VLVYTGGRLLNRNYFSQHTEALAAYIDGTYHFNEKLSLTLGGRYSYDDKKFVFLPIGANGAITPSTAPCPNPPNATCIPSFTINTKFDTINRKFTPRAVLRY